MDGSTELLGLFTGRAVDRWQDKPASAIGKSARDAPVYVTELGLEGDEQADLTAHGGPDQAIHHYASEHHAYWKEAFPEHTPAFVPGCFGENISTRGMDETTICIGDIFTVGSAVLQVSQGRKPCWKLDAHMLVPGLAGRFTKTAKTGWYYRVLETGTIPARATMQLIERLAPEWTVMTVTKARFDPRLGPEIAKALSNLPQLSQVWRAHFLSRS